MQQFGLSLAAMILAGLILCGASRSEAAEPSNIYSLTGFARSKRS